MVGVNLKGQKERCRYTGYDSRFEHSESYFDENEGILLTNLLVR